MGRSSASRRTVLIATSSLIGLFSLAWSARSGPHPPPFLQGVGARVLAWNDLGMHCIDPDLWIFSILPPYNNVNAQVIVDGDLLALGVGWSITYEAVADPTGSINTTSIGKTNFWDFEDDLFGTQLQPDVGLAGFAMPGLANTPQDMQFRPTWSGFQAEGIPITPIDDAGRHNKYPLVRIVVRDPAGTEVAETVTSVPNADELNCAVRATSPAKGRAPNGHLGARPSS